jgi:hypothetical protein
MFAVMMGVLVLLPCLGNAADTGKNADPQALDILRNMSDYLAGIQKFGCRIQEYFDRTTETGERIQYSNNRAIGIWRPGMFVGETTGDTINNQFWYDGTTVTILDKTHNVYGVIQAPATIDATLDFLRANYEIVFPLCDILYSDIYNGLITKIQSGTYAGLHYAAGELCHHLVFTQDNIDWQVWIATGDAPLPKKVVITYKQRPGYPQYMAVFTKWNINPEASKDLFKFTPPEGAVQKELKPVKKTAVTK